MLQVGSLNNVAEIVLFSICQRVIFFFFPKSLLMLKMASGKVEKMMLCMVVKETFKKISFSPSSGKESYMIRFSLCGAILRCMVAKALKKQRIKMDIETPMPLKIVRVLLLLFF